MVLGTTTGALVLFSVLLVLAIGWLTASHNTQGLSVERFNLMLNMLENQVNDELTPAREQMDSLSRILTSGAVNPVDHKEVQNLLMDAIASTPQVKRLVVIGTDHKVVGAERQENKVVPMDQYAGPALIEQYDAVATSNPTTASWLAPPISALNWDPVLFSDNLCCSTGARSGSFFRK
jgi:hypothetical protein